MTNFATVHLYKEQNWVLPPSHYKNIHTYASKYQQTLMMGRWQKLIIQYIILIQDFNIMSYEYQTHHLFSFRGSIQD